MRSAMNAYIIGTSRVIQSMSAGFFIPVMQDLNKRGTPGYALIAACAVSGALLLFSSHFDRLATASVITTLIPYIFFCLASWMLVTEIKSRLVFCRRRCFNSRNPPYLLHSIRDRLQMMKRNMTNRSPDFIRIQNIYLKSDYGRDIFRDYLFVCGTVYYS